MVANSQPSRPPHRVQMSRQRPWRTEHPDAVIVDRRTKWGNPFRVYRCPCCGHWDVRDNNDVTYVIDHAVARTVTPDRNGQRYATRKAVELFWLDFEWGAGRIDELAVRAELAGLDLACWCPLDQPCHADVLLEIANGGAE